MTEYFFFTSLFLLFFSLLLFSSLCNFLPYGFSISLALEHLFLMLLSMHTHCVFPPLFIFFPLSEFFPIQPSLQLLLVLPSWQPGH